MGKKQKLELTWIGKEKRPQLEPRILLEDAEKSYHAKHRFSDSDIFDNRLIFGDNLLALKALEQESECAAILQQIAAIRGAVNGLMGQVLEHHIREHLGAADCTPQQRQQDLEVVLTALRSYLK